jgi:Tol biopolymer transport system component/DNA-binding winged helix-turn-helix (wHTH) protein
MGTQPNQRPSVTFGPFIYDGSAGELRKHGTRLRLSGQPLRILEVLLEEPRKVYSRDEIQRRLWSGTTFVDFEHGLNAAMNKLRQVLGDSADQPQYIETVPGRGYRFISQVERVSPRVLLEMVQPAEPNKADVQSSASECEPIQPHPEEPANRRWDPRAAAIFGLAILAILACFLGWRAANSPQSPPKIQTVRYRVPIPEGMQLSPSQTFSLSPDGTTLVYLASGPDSHLRLWAQSLDSLEPRVLPGTDSLDDPNAFWSPDSKTVVFYANGSLKRTDLIGNPPQVICAVPGIVLGGSWNRDGTIIFGTATGGIMRVPATGGEATPVTTRDAARVERLHGFPTFLPDGRHFLYSRFSSVADRSGVFVGSINTKPGDQELRRLVASPFGAQLVVSPEGNGKVLFLRDSTLWAQDFDTFRRELTGEPAPVAEHVGSVRAFGFFASSNSGALIHRSGLRDVSRLTWFDRHGQQLAPVGDLVDLEDPPALSPDGTRVAMAKFDGGSIDVWVQDLSRGVNQRLTFDPALDSGPAWSPDGKHIAFSSSRAGHYDLYQISASGEGREELLLASGENKFVSSWSPDGRYLLYSTQVDPTNSDIWVLPLEGPGRRTPFSVLHGPANERSGKLSPDGKALAYVSDESGTAEVYVQPFSPPLASGSLPVAPKLQVSGRGGNRPHWRADGKSLFYHTPDGTLMSVALQKGAPLKLAVPDALFHLPGMWDAGSDGNKFLVAVPEAQTAPPSFTVVLNWQAEFRK